MAALAVGSLWHLIPGTLISVLILVLLMPSRACERTTCPESTRPMGPRLGRRPPLELALGSVIGFGPGWLAIPGGRCRRPDPDDPGGGDPGDVHPAGAIPFVGPLLAAVAWVAILVTITGSTTGQGIHDRLAAGTRVVTA